jgi:20S proteasome subunit alpha 3
MSRRYDSRTTIFSPEGRLYQVEYALEAINHAGTAIGILAKDGIALVAERKVTSKLLEQDCSAEKMYILNGTTLCAVAGMTADAAILVEYMRESSQEYLKIYNREPPVEHLVKKVCNFKQGYTQFGGLRPFGVSFLIAGYDERHEFQLYTSNPSGNYSGWRATSIGGNSSSAQTVLKQQLQEAAASTDATDASNALPTLEEAQKMALRVLGKTSDSTALTAERLEVATVALESNGRVQLRVWTPADVGKLLEESGVLEGEEAQE